MWTPTESDLKWCRNLIEMIKENGIWECDAGVYRVEHSNKRLVRLEANFNEYMHDLNVIAFREIGFEIVEEAK